MIAASSFLYVPNSNGGLYTYVYVVMIRANDPAAAITDREEVFLAYELADVKHLQS
jgi:hypothetical protein